MRIRLDRSGFRRLGHVQASAGGMQGKSGAAGARRTSG